MAHSGSRIVGVVGPHPEANESWFSAVGLPAPRGSTIDLARDLISTTLSMERKSNTSVDGVECLLAASKDDPTPRDLATRQIKKRTIEPIGVGQSKQMAARHDDGFHANTLA